MLNLDIMIDEIESINKVNNDFEVACYFDNKRRKMVIGYSLNI